MANASSAGLCSSAYRRFRSVAHVGDSQPYPVAAGRASVANVADSPLHDFPVLTHKRNTQSTNTTRRSIR